MLENTAAKLGFAGTPEDLAKINSLEQRSLLLKNCNQMPILPSEYQPPKKSSEMEIFYDLQCFV